MFSHVVLRDIGFEDHRLFTAVKIADENDRSARRAFAIDEAPKFETHDIFRMREAAAEPGVRRVSVDCRSVVNSFDVDPHPSAA